jgi:hypothetical protein
MNQNKINQGYTNIALILISQFITVLPSIIASAQEKTGLSDRGGIVVYEKDGHGLVVTETEVGYFNISKMMYWDKANKVCENYSGKGYSDWRLPTKEELELIYKSPMVKLKKHSYYWSGEEVDEQYALAMYSTGGLITNNYKYYACYVRAVRRF